MIENVSKRYLDDVVSKAAQKISQAQLKALTRDPEGCQDRESAEEEASAEAAGEALSRSQRAEKEAEEEGIARGHEQVRGIVKFITS